ncbi:MAG: DUF4190 domain-containing protein [Actinomycetota bacterium]|nr:DUF4190 domain-containing protein [Actinomycetota bacterium]
MSDTPPVPPVPPASGVPPIPPPPAATVPPAPPAVPEPARPNPYEVTPTPYGATAPPYGSQGYASQQYAAAPPTNTLAIVALILAFFVPLGGVICGHMALGQIKRTGQGGHGLALAGTVLGYVFIGLGILIGVIYAIIVVAAVSSSNSYGNF